jgi:hypothetical protein
MIMLFPGTILTEEGLDCGRAAGDPQPLVCDALGA